jgi:undecaprenyl-diphosphatase
MTSGRADRTRHELAPLITVTVAALVFAILLIAVRLQWAPLESADHGAAAHLNSLVAGHAALVSVVKAVTWLGSTGVLWVVIGVSAVVLAIRKRWRLAIYVVVTGAGAQVLDPILKSLIGRLRPVVAHPIAYGGGDSFPSGHSLGSIVCYGAVFLVFLPAMRGRWRTVFITVIAALVVLIGISRILLGVHFLSDVLGAWAIGIVWLGVTATAFELTRHADGQPVTDPITDGLEPEAGADLRPTKKEPAMGGKSAKDDGPARRYGRIAAGVLVAWVLILGIIVGIGELITKDGNGNVLGDKTIPRWFAAHRTPSWTHWSLIFTTLGATTAILIVSVVTCVVFLAVTRRWRPVVFLAVVMFGELAAFLAAAAVVKRPRPDVTHMDTHLPTSAYPSGHVAATTCLYVAIAILVIGHAHGWWRYLFLIPAIAMPILVALSRMYRGEHHPTDVLGSLIFAGLWLTATTLLIKPNEDADRRGQLPGRKRHESKSRVRAFGKTVSASKLQTVAVCNVSLPWPSASQSSAKGLSKQACTGPSTEPTRGHLASGPTARRNAPGPVLGPRLCTCVT